MCTRLCFVLSPRQPRNESNEESEKEIIVYTSIMCLLTLHMSAHHCSPIAIDNVLCRLWLHMAVTIAEKCSGFDMNNLFFCTEITVDYCQYTLLQVVSAKKTYQHYRKMPHVITALNLWNRTAMLNWNGQDLHVLDGIIL